MTKANIVDSSAWLEYLANTRNSANFARPIEDAKNLLVPVICIYEVFKKVLRERGEDVALQVASVMQTGRIVDLDASLALEAAHYQLPLADSIIYASTIRHRATLWTQDEHFEGMPSVRYFRNDR